MKKENLLLILLFTFSIPVLKAQTYFTGFDNSTQQSGWAQYRKGATGLYQWNYATNGAFSAPNSLTHNYPVGGSTPTDDWFVSPPFNLSSGGNIDSVRFAFSGFGLPATGDTVAIYILNGSADPVMATTKTMLMDFRDSNYVNDNNWRVKTNISLPASGGQSYIAFRYKTVVNWLDVKFDNLKLSGISTAGMEYLDAKNSIVLYPNPFTKFVTVSIDEHLINQNNLSIKIFNSIGKLLLEKELFENEPLEINQPAGIYFYQISNLEKTILKSGRLVVQ